MSTTTPTRTDRLTEAAEAAEARVQRAYGTLRSRSGLNVTENASAALAAATTAVTREEAAILLVVGLIGELRDREKLAALHLEAADTWRDLRVHLDHGDASTDDLEAASAHAEARAATNAEHAATWRSLARLWHDRVGLITSL